MYFYAARQPILDKNKQLFGYELLFRDSIENIFPDVDSDEATSKLIEASQFNMDLVDFTANKPAFINFTLETLERGLPKIVPKEELVVEILETIKPGKRLLAHCKELHELGYTLALDDYEHQSVWQHFYPYIDIIKIDVLATTVEQIKEIKLAISPFPHIKLLAEKVETPEQYQQMQDLGFDLFQGYFFAKPEMVKAKELSPSQMAMAELLYESSKPDLDLKAITAIFERDVSLSYKLLRYANSAMFARRAEISSIKQALVSLGSVELKRFNSLMFTANVNPNKPSELITLSMIRAKFCELCAENLPGKHDPSLFFLTGLLSMIDAILDEELTIVLDKLPLASSIKEALLTHKGPMAALIKLVELIEKAQWDKVQLVMDKLHLKKDDVLKHYNEAVNWGDELTKLAL
jgi:EAL and modified HD-GYP domain-containing signal transduction protein